MFSPYLGFQERDIYGVFKIILTNFSGSPSSAASGLALQANTADLAPNTPSTYANSLGDLIPASIITASGAVKETGWLLQPVTSSGPSLLSLLSTVYDESVASGNTAAVIRSSPGAFIATDQYVVSSGTGGINWSSPPALDASFGLASGQPRALQAGDTARLMYKGSVYQRQIQCALFQII